MAVMCRMPDVALTLRAAPLGFGTIQTIWHWLPCYICNVQPSFGDERRFAKLVLDAHSVATYRGIVATVTDTQCELLVCCTLRGFDYHSSSGESKGSTLYLRPNRGTQSHKKPRMFHNTPHKLICCTLHGDSDSESVWTLHCNLHGFK